jgi:hypothetical protein
MKLALKLVMRTKLGSVGLFICGIILSSKTSWAEEISAIPHVLSDGSAISAVDTNLPSWAGTNSAKETDKTFLADAGLSIAASMDSSKGTDKTSSIDADFFTVAGTDPPKEADKDIDRQEIKADKKEIVEDETIIEAWARDLSQKALKCLEEDEAKISSLVRSARGIVWVVPETLGTLLGVHVGSALGFYRKSDQHWGLPIVYQVESETPVKWSETKLLVVPIEDEKTQVSMLLPQWSYAMEMLMPQGPVMTLQDTVHQESLIVLEKSSIIREFPKNPFWTFPESKDFPKAIELRFHFNREINEELYGIKNIRAVDIVFDSSIPPYLRALWNCLEALK